MIKKLLIGIPSIDYQHTEFVKSLTGLVMKLKDDGINFDVDIEAGTLVYLARNRITCKAINEGYSHVLWLDADMVFTPDILDDLQFSGKPFVTGIAHSRRPGYQSCLFSDLDINHLTRFEEYPKDTFEVQGCGFACVLIETSILEAVQKESYGAFLPMREYGEDLAFCVRARKLGYKIYAEPGVRLGHVGHIVVYPEERERWLRDYGNT